MIGAGARNGHAVDQHIQAVISHAVHDRQTRHAPTPCQRYAWNAIQNVELNQGELRVTLRAGQTLKLYASEIPNVELMCPLIGVKLGYRALERAA